MPQEIVPREPQIQPSSVPQPLTVQYATRKVMVHTLTSAELDGVASLGNSLNLTFFGLCAGALIAFGIVLSTGSPANPITHATYVALTSVSAMGTLYFGIKAIIDYRESSRKLKALKNSD